MNNIIPNFGAETWEATTGDSPNRAAQLIKCEYDTQQPYLRRYAEICEAHQIHLVGVSRLPYEPRSARLPDYAKILWNPTKGVQFTPQNSLIRTENSLTVSVPFIDTATWNITANTCLYQWEDFNMGGTVAHYQVPIPAGSNPTRRKVKDGVKISWN